MRQAVTTREDARKRLIFPLDVPTVREAEALAASLEGSVSFFKVGLELWCAGGRDFAASLASSGHDVFLDLKLHDIPATVAAATRAVAGLGARLLNVHGPSSSARAAAQARGPDGRLALLGVTVLTSMTAEECRTEFGLAPGRDVAELVVERARMFAEAGCDGVVASAHEAVAIRKALPNAIILTPGIRMPGDDVGDQARVATPREAARAGADYLVVGRPIRDAADRRAAVELIVDDIWAGFQARQS